MPSKQPACVAQSGVSVATLLGLTSTRRSLMARRTRQLVNLQRTEGNVHTVVAVEQRHPAGGFRSAGLTGGTDESAKTS